MLWAVFTYSFLCVQGMEKFVVSIYLVGRSRDLSNNCDRVALLVVGMEHRTMLGIDEVVWRV